MGPECGAGSKSGVKCRNRLILTKFTTFFTFIRIMSAVAFTTKAPGSPSIIFRMHVVSRYRDTFLQAASVPSEESSQNCHQLRQKLPGSNNVWIMSREVPIFLQSKDNSESNLENSSYVFPNGCITVWELDKPSDLINSHWSISASLGSNTRRDPFGVVMWPGSILASREMAAHQSEIENQTVVVLGAGTGVEAQAAAFLGAKRVLALDVNKLTLKLANHGAKFASLDHIIECQEFDVFSEEAIPQCDVMIAADVLYNEELAQQIGERCKEVLIRNPALKLIVTDSQRFHGTDFLVKLNKEREKDGLEIFRWEHHILETVTGSGVLIEEDQTYDAETRMFSVGWNKLN